MLPAVARGGANWSNSKLVKCPRVPPLGEGPPSSHNQRVRGTRREGGRERERERESERESEGEKERWRPAGPSE